MALNTWWRGDPLPSVASDLTIRSERTEDVQLIAKLTKLRCAEIQTRFDQGHHPYVAWVQQYPVAYGWVATRAAMIGELGIDVMLSLKDRYLWDFATVPAWRGRGIYPRLLQTIVTDETPHATRFWIVHAPENGASRAGIRKAGFQPIGELAFRLTGGVGLRPLGASNRIDVAAALFGIPLVLSPNTEKLLPCWHCGSMGICHCSPPSTQELQHVRTARCLCVVEAPR